MFPTRGAASRAFRQGREYAAMSRMAMAFDCFAEAASLAPKNPLYRATVRKLLKQKDSKIMRAASDTLRHVYADDAALCAEITARTLYLDLTGAHRVDGREGTEARLKGLDDVALFDAALGDFLRGGVYMTPYFNEISRRSRDNPDWTPPDGHMAMAAILQSGARVVERVRDDPDLMADLSTVLAADESLSILLAIVEHAKQSGAALGPTCSDPDTVLARGLLSQSRSAFRLHGTASAAVEYLASRADDGDGDAQAEFDAGWALMRRVTGVRDGSNLRAAFYGVEVDVDRGLKHLRHAASQRPDDKMAQAYLRHARRQAAPSILFAAFPRSGSVFVYTSLIRGLDKPGFGGVHGGAFPNYTLAQEGLNIMLAARGSAHTHIRATPVNRIEISDRYGIDKMLVSVRDPRQVLMSWYNLMAEISDGQDPVQVKHYQLPSGYAKLPASQQLDWMIENWLPLLVQWLEEWRAASLDDDFRTEIYFARFEDMRSNQTAFFNGILDFFGIDRDLFEPPLPPKGVGDRNFRQGHVDSWRQECKPAQIERMKAFLSNDFLDFFGWSRFD